MHKQTNSLSQASSKDEMTSALQTQLLHLVRLLSTFYWYRLTMVIAAAATAVLTDVPGTMLLSDVLTSTATMKRFPTGSTF